MARNWVEEQNSAAIDGSTLIATRTKNQGKKKTRESLLIRRDRPLF